MNFIDTLNASKSNKMILNSLKNQADIILEVNKENPEFLFYDMWGTEHLKHKYNNSIKIAFYSENYLPDLNHADYALSQAHIMYLDRFFKFPVFIPVLNKINNKDIQKIRRDSLKKKKKFCAAVKSINKTSEYFRFNFSRDLNK